MVRRDLARSRAEAKRLIEAGKVGVGLPGKPKASTTVTEETLVELAEDDRRWVSRGARKLLAALDSFPIEIPGKRAIDIGASTGGFTEVLLHRGARQVVAVDVGTGQLAPSLKRDSRVISIEQTNIRDVSAVDLGDPFAMVVVDLSFISIRVVAPKLHELAADEADLVVLVKPQYEVQRSDLGKQGILRDVTKRVKAVETVITAMNATGLGCRGIIRSPIEGSRGNIEYLLWCQRGARVELLEVPS
jgi:23S rRNA (cytidine1920-2'-O)/16S rRNA (cytidine1409-2'-O)-methyltransferase